MRPRQRWARFRERLKRRWLEARSARDAGDQASRIAFHAGRSAETRCYQGRARRRHRRYPLPCLHRNRISRRLLLRYRLFLQSRRHRPNRLRLPNRKPLHQRRAKQHRGSRSHRPVLPLRQHQVGSKLARNSDCSAPRRTLRTVDASSSSIFRLVGRRQCQHPLSCSATAATRHLRNSLRERASPSLQTGTVGLF